MEPSWDFDWVCAPDPRPQSVIHDNVTSLLVVTRLPLYPLRGPWLCVPSSRTVCPWHRSDSGSACIDTAQDKNDVFGRLCELCLGALGRPGGLSIAPGLELATSTTPGAGDLVRRTAEAGNQLAGPPAGRAGSPIVL